MARPLNHETPPSDGASVSLESGQLPKAAAHCGRGLGVVVERVAAGADRRAGGGDEVAATDLNSGSGPSRATSTCGAVSVMLPSAPFQPSLTVEGDLVAIDGGHGAVEDGLEGRQVRRVVDEARGDAATGCRVAGGSGVSTGSGSPRSGAESGRRSRCRGRRRTRARSRRRRRGRRPRERAAGMSDGGIVLLSGHEVLLDPRRHAGETRVGYVVRMDRVGSAQPVDRIGSGRDAHSPTPFQSAPCVPFTSADVRLGSRYFRSSSGELRARASAKRARARWRRMATAFGVIPRTAAIGLVPELLPGDEAQDLLVGGRQGAEGGEGGAVASSPARIGVATSSTRRSAASRSRGRCRGDGWPGPAGRPRRATEGVRRRGWRRTCARRW